MIRAFQLGLGIKMDPLILSLLMGSIIIVVGFICNYIFEKTGFPDMLLLIILGIILGPLIRLIEPTFTRESLMGLAPYLAALAIIFILFDGGMKMNIYQIFSESPRAVLLATLGFTLSTLTITLLMMFAAGFPPRYALLFGTINGGSSSIAVISLAHKIKVSEKTSIILSLESAMTDVLCIVVSLAVLAMITGANHTGYADVGKMIASQFSVGAVLGVLFGVAWLGILRKAIKLPYAYMLTVGMLLFSYALSQELGGSGALTCLLFGIVLGNEREINRILKRERPSLITVDEGLKRFEAEIAFLIRSFFFVFLGLIAVLPNPSGGAANWNLFIFYGMVISLLLLLVRYLAVTVASVKSEIRAEKTIIWVVLARGLAAAVLSTFPAQDSYKGYFDLSRTGKPNAPDWYINVALIIILVTAVICTLGIFLISKKKREEISL